MSNLDVLFRPFTNRGLILPNRIVMAPMTRSFSPNGVPGENVSEYYARRAAADIGLIITEGTTIDRAGASNDPNVPNFHTDEALAGWKNIAEAVHAVNGKIAPQLWHVGMVRKPGTGPHPQAESDGPSGVTHTGKSVQPAPSESEIADMISAYAKSALYAKNLGFDAVEIHGAHGYLIDQFFWEVMNQREDRYGGNLVDRVNFAAEIIGEVRAAVGDSIPVILRFSQWKQQDYTARLAPTPQELEIFLAPLVSAGVDILHCSQRRFWEAEFPEQGGADGDMNLAGWTKKITGCPTISVGSVGLSSDFFTAFTKQNSKCAPLDQLGERMERGEFDLIAVGRALLNDPFWAQKVREGRLDELTDYDGEALAKLY